MNLHEKQKKFVGSDADKTAYIGGRQSGKTEALVHVAIDHAKNGKNVTFAAPYQRLIINISERIRTKLQQKHQNTQNKINLLSGGNIRFTSLGHVRQKKITCDTLLLDEFQKVNSYRLSNIKCDKMYVAGTPMGAELRFVDTDWNIILSPTSANPSVKRSLLNQFRENLQNPWKRTMTPLIAGDHGLIPLHNDKSLYKCIFCNFEAEVERTPEQQKYVIGKALHTNCINRNI